MSSKIDIYHDDKCRLLDLMCGEETLARFQKLASEDSVDLPEIADSSTAAKTDSVRIGHRARHAFRIDRLMFFAGRLILMSLALLGVGAFAYTILYMCVSYE